MSLFLAAQYTRREYRWTGWKAVHEVKAFVYQYDDDGSIYTIWGYDGPEVHVCQIFKGSVPTNALSLYSQEQNDADKTDFVNNFLLNTNKILTTQVVTQFERDDKRLKIAKGEASFNEEGSAEILVEISSGGRYIAGGYAFTDVFFAGDYVNGVELVDVNNVFGYGAGVTLASYIDNDAVEDNRGWYFEPHAPNNGYIEIEPIGGYGFMPQGTFLRVRAKKAVGSTATKFLINIWWGKVE